MTKKIAVVLFNLGGPDNPAAVEPFLCNLFSDPAIIRLPGFLRLPLAKFISSRRAKIAQGIYGKIGGRSPILENTKAQAEALERHLNPPPLEGEQGERDCFFRCFVSMRYWHPFAEETVAEVKKFAPDEIILLPLYPQFSTTTTASSLKNWQETAAAQGLAVRTRTICCYPEKNGFIRTLADAVRKAYEKAAASGRPRLLFSAHGLPEKIIRAGDPYQWQCERTAKILKEAIGIDGLEAVLCYQSRVGRLKWIGPSTESEVKRAGRDGAPVIVVPVAFVSEHSETLVEIDMELREIAVKCGVPFFDYVPAVGTAEGFIEGLANLVRAALDLGENCISGTGARFCPGEFKGCWMRQQAYE